MSSTIKPKKESRYISIRAVVPKLFSLSMILIKKVHSVEKMKYWNFFEKNAKISIHKFPDLVSKV